MNLAKNTLFVTLASVLAAALGYAFNPLMVARPLGPEGIAILGIFLSLNQALSFPQRPITLGLIRRISHYGAQKDQAQVKQLLLGAITRNAVVGLLIVIGLILFSAPISNYLRLASTTPVIAAVLLAYTGLLLTIVRCSLQALLRFKSFALGTIGDPLFRVLIGVIILWKGISLSSAMLAYIASYLFTILVCIGLLKDILNQKGKTAPCRNEPQGATPAIWVYSIYMGFVLSMDAIIVKRYFTDQAAGMYMAASMLAKMMFIVITPLHSVSYSLFCNSAAKKESLSPLLIKSLGIALGSCILMTGGAFLFSKGLVHLTYGSEFNETIALFPLTCLALIPIILAMTMSQYAHAKQSTLFIYGLVLGGIIQFTLMSFFHKTIFHVLLTYAAGGILSCFLGILFNSFERPKS